MHRRLTAKDDIAWGPFQLGRAGVPITIAALIYSVIGIVFSFFPPTVDVKPETMNWSIVVFSGVAIFSVCFWAVYGRFQYKGPIQEVDYVE